MKSHKPKLTVAMICLATFMANVTYGQSSGDKNSADWPKDQDAVIAARKTHKILLENDTVRVLEVRFYPVKRKLFIIINGQVYYMLWKGKILLNVTEKEM